MTTELLQPVCWDCAVVVVLVGVLDVEVVAGMLVVVAWVLVEVLVVVAGFEVVTVEVFKVLLVSFVLTVVAVVAVVAAVVVGCDPPDPAVYTAGPGIT